MIHLKYSVVKKVIMSFLRDFNFSGIKFAVSSSTELTASNSRYYLAIVICYLLTATLPS